LKSLNPRFESPWGHLYIALQFPGQIAGLWGFLLTSMVHPSCPVGEYRAPDSPW